MLLDDLGDILQRENVGNLGTDVFLGAKREDVDNLAVIIPTGGYAQNSKIKDIKPTFQIYVRDVIFINGYTKINNIFNILDLGDSRLIISPSGRKILSKAMQPPFYIGKDENNRHEFVFNVMMVTTRD